MKLVEVKHTVNDILTNDIGSRNNDIRLMRIFLEKSGLPTDIRYLEEMTSNNIFDTVSRTRRKLQQENPFLQATESVIEKREKKEEDMKEWIRNW